jgi:hypothetical protein
VRYTRHTSTRDECGNFKTPELRADGYCQTKIRPQGGNEYVVYIRPRGRDQDFAKRSTVSIISLGVHSGHPTKRHMFESKFPVDKVSYSYPAFWNAAKS